MAIDYSQKLDALRSTLLTLPDSGPDGFEGLVATALADLTGLTFRLAKSGSQFGRDAATPSAPFAIAMEAKRYRDKLRLEDLAGKATVATFELAGDIDLWVLCATSELGDGVEAKLRMILGAGGITLLSLDWSLRPEPHLAVALAAGQNAVLEWFGQHAPGVDRAALSNQLEAIKSRSSFADQELALRRTLCAGQTGLDALRRSSSVWLSARLADRDASQLSFGQFITVSEPGAPALRRDAVLAALGAAVASHPAQRRVVVVLGEEGAGKTWLVAQWWAELPDPPILIVVAGHRTRSLDPTDAIGSLALLLAEQDGRSDPDAIASWERRLHRWSGAGPAEHLRFVIFFDGLNEATALPWAGIIQAFTVLLKDLGGLVIVTCRDGYWKRDVTPRLARSLDIQKVLVPGYSDAELRTVLAGVKVELNTLPAKVREFIRNPRVCAVAVHLLDRLSVRPEDLTRERLLLEYWQWRVQERSDQIVHNVRDFEKLLKSHARAWLAQNGPFDRDDWADHSGAVKRGDSRNAHADLTEIEEGRFMTVSDEDSQSYEFRQESLPFALGLLINDELRIRLKAGETDVSGALEEIIGPVRGFDYIAEILAASAGLAALDDTFPTSGRSALIRYWLGLQNVDDEAFSAMASYVPARPDAFLDVAEFVNRSDDATQSLTSLLFSRRDDDRVRTALEERLPFWLGRWSRQSARFGASEDYEKRQMKRNDDIDASLAGLTSAEQDTFRSLTNEVSTRASMRLDQTAAMLMAGRPLTPLAAGWVGWAWAEAIAGDFYDAGETLAWVARLNTQDREAFRDEIRRLTGDISGSSSEKARRAAAIAMRLTGDDDLAGEAFALAEPFKGERWRRVENYCETNPHDPDAERGDNVSHAVERIGEVDPEALWRSMSTGGEDHEVELAGPALARFEPGVLIEKLRSTVATAATRTGLPLRQLAWRLPGVSPVFDQACVDAVRTASRSLLEDPSRLDKDDVEWIHCQLVQALNPHLEAEQQLDLLISLPEKLPLFLNLRSALRPLSAELFEQRLAGAEGETLTRTLFFASANRVALTPRSREIVFEALKGDDEAAWSAADIAFMARDEELDDLILAMSRETGWGRETGESAFYKSRVLTAAISRRKRTDFIEHAPSRFIGALADDLGADAVALLGDRIEAVFDRLLSDVEVEAPEKVELFMSSSRDGMSEMRWADDVEEEGPADLHSRLQELANPEESAREFSDRQKRRLESTRRYHKELSQVDAQELATSPPFRGLDKLGADYPERMERILDRILVVSDPRILRQIRNIGLAAAAAGAARAPEKSAAVFKRLREVRPPVNIVIDDAKTPLFDKLLFETADHPAFESVKRARILEAFDDGELEAAIRAVEDVGAHEWLDRLARELVATGSTPHVARGLAISGLRDANPVSDELLKLPFHPGFLGEVSAWANKQYQRNGWARHWYDEAVSANDPVDFWRFASLAEGVVDTRYQVWTGLPDDADLERRFGEPFDEALRKAAEKRRKKRGDTLFGHKAPHRNLVVVLRDTPKAFDLEGSGGRPAPARRRKS